MSQCMEHGSEYLLMFFQMFTGPSARCLVGLSSMAFQQFCTLALNDHKNAWTAHCKPTHFFSVQSEHTVRKLYLCKRPSLSKSSMKWCVRFGLSRKLTTYWKDLHEIICTDCPTPFGVTTGLQAWLIRNGMCTYFRFNVFVIFGCFLFIVYYVYFTW